MTDTLRDNMETTSTYYRTTVYLSNDTLIIKDFRELNDAKNFRQYVRSVGTIQDKHLDLEINPDHIVSVEIRAWDSDSNQDKKAYEDSAFWVKNPKRAVAE